MSFFKITLKISLVYRWSVVFQIIGSILFIALSILLWRFLYQGTPTMISYMTKYTIVSNILSMFYARGIAQQIGDKVVSGSFVTDLIRPVNLFSMSWQMELANICSSFLLKGLPILIIYSPFLIVNASYYNIPTVILVIILGHILFLLIYALIGFLAFILIEIWPFGRLLDDTIRLLAGAFIPLALLPEFLRTIAYILPFRFLYSFPLELLLGSADTSKLVENFAIMMTWICVFATLNVIVYRLAVKKAVVQGG